MTARDLFVGADGRPRWGWRLVIFIVATALALMLFSAPVVGFMAAGARLSKALEALLSEWLSMLALLAATALMLRAVERRRWEFVAMGRGAARGGAIASGLLLGTLAIGVPSGLLLLTHWLRLDPSGAGSWGGTALTLLVTLAPAAMWEELMFRGYPFAVLRERFGAGVALGVTSLLFGLVHVSNAGAAPLPISMVIVAGVFLGGVMLATRSLYAAWAAHFAWNWTMAALFHQPVSGYAFPTPDYKLVEVGPDWLTGGTWGTEGGVGALVGMGAAMLYLFGRSRGRAFGAPTADGSTDTLPRPVGREES